MTFRFLNHVCIRNHRNLELLAIQPKSAGYQYENNAQRHSYIYRVEFQPTNKHTSGAIRHYKDGIVLSASTKEWAVAKQLYSNVDTNAARNIGRLLALRALQCGIHFALADADKDRMQRDQHMLAFFTALADGGIILEEPKHIEQTYAQDRRLTYDTYPTVHTKLDKLDDE